MGRRTLVAVTLALALGGCGSDDPERPPVAKSPTAERSAAATPEASMRSKIVEAHTQVSQAYARWDAKVENATDDETVGETHRFVIVLRSVRDVVASDRGGNASDERLRLDYVHAADAFARALSAFADYLEAGSRKQLDRTVKRVQRTGARYDAVVARANR
jgi:hypothetical protein